MKLKLEKKQPIRKDNKQIKIYVNEALYKDFEQKLKEDKLTKKEVLETAIYQYLNGIMVINKD